MTREKWFSLLVFVDFVVKLDESVILTRDFLILSRRLTKFPTSLYKYEIIIMTFLISPYMFSITTDNHHNSIVCYR